MDVVVLREPTDQLVVAGVRRVLHSGRFALDVYTQTLVILAGLSAQQFGVRIRNDCRHADFPRTDCLDTVGRDTVDYGRVLFGSKLRKDYYISVYHSSDSKYPSGLCADEELRPVQRATCVHGQNDLSSAGISALGVRDTE